MYIIIAPLIVGSYNPDLPNKAWYTPRLLCITVQIDDEMKKLKTHDKYTIWAIYLCMRGGGI